MINYQFFPRSHGVTPEIQAVINCFKKIEPILDDGTHRVSNDVLALLLPHLESCGYDVEKGKGAMKKSMFLYFLAKIMPLTNLSMQMLSTRNRVLSLRLKRVVQ